MFSPYNPSVKEYLTSCLPFRLRHPETDCHISHTVVVKKKDASLRLQPNVDKTKCIWMFERYKPGLSWTGGVLHWGEVS